MLAIKHRQYPVRCTFAVGLPTKVQLLEIIANGIKSVVLPFGIGFVHPKDKFIKSMGRKIATTNQAHILFFLHKIEIRETNRVVYTFCNTFINPIGKNYSIELGISFVPESNHVRLEYGTVY